MKKIIASLAAVALAAALCCAFVSAAETSGTGPADTNVAQGKTYTTTTAAYGDDENAFYLDEAGIKLTDGIIGDKVPWSADAYVKLAKAAEGTDAFSSVVIDPDLHPQPLCGQLLCRRKRRRLLSAGCKGLYQRRQNDMDACRRHADRTG